jgi:hypothetical protein
MNNAMNSQQSGGAVPKTNAENNKKTNIDQNKQQQNLNSLHQPPPFPP